MYAPPAALGPNSTQTCGTTPESLHLGVEDLPGAAAAGEHLHLVGDPRAGAVDEVDHRDPQRQRALLDADDLLDGLGPPRAGLHRRVVGHDGDRAAADAPEAGDDAVGAEPVLLPVGEQRLLDERVVVEQPRDPLAHRQLALLGGLLAVAVGTAGVGAVQRLLEVLAVGHRSSTSVGSSRRPARRRVPEEAVRGRLRLRCGATGIGAGGGGGGPPASGDGGSGWLGRSPIASSPPASRSSTSGQPISDAPSRAGRTRDQHEQHEHDDAEVARARARGRRRA